MLYQAVLDCAMPADREISVLPSAPIDGAAKWILKMRTA